MHLIVSEADVATLLAAPFAVLYKHSPICSTSGFAYDEMLAFRRLSRVPVYLVDVVKHRAISRDLAERTGVTHASPQAIILWQGVAAWHRSHFGIEAQAMTRVVSHLTEGEDVGRSDEG
jgi:bacillithiol system protein YtxJ